MKNILATLGLTLALLVVAHPAHAQTATSSGADYSAYMEVKPVCAPASSANVSWTLRSGQVPVAYEWTVVGPGQNQTGSGTLDSNMSGVITAKRSDVLGKTAIGIMYGKASYRVLAGQYQGGEDWTCLLSPAPVVAPTQQVSIPSVPTSALVATQVEDPRLVDLYNQLITLYKAILAQLVAR